MHQALAETMLFCIIASSRFTPWRLRVNMQGMGTQRDAPCGQAVGTDAVAAARDALGAESADAELSVLQRLACSSLDPLKRIGAGARALPRHQQASVPAALFLHYSRGRARRGRRACPLAYAGPVASCACRARFKRAASLLLFCVAGGLAALLISSLVEPCMSSAENT